MSSIDEYRREFERAYSWFSLLKGKCQTLSSETNKVIYLRVIEDIAFETGLANIALCSLVGMADEDMKELPDRDLVKKIQLVNRLSMPCDVEEAQTIIKSVCCVRTLPVTRVRDGLKSMLGLTYGVQLIAQQATFLHGSSYQTINAFHTRVSGMCAPALLKWQRLGQLIVAIHHMNQKELHTDSTF
ncbi:hypothetical protein IT408_00645 [Candidatus Uhrbacteria bacterium]|nr:hypothetical protein [Candidatus Uhrbacteria bacterium]